ncbi:MAG: DNA adenine methylase [Planctomycetes bacterium]|nr:DNA adenine methylase [Planctomycetota bacterium]
MRLIGNKTKLLGSIEEFLTERGVVGGTFLDVFAGTASVGRHFRARGFQVRSNDLMVGSAVRQHTYIALRRYPSLAKVRDQQPVRRFLRSPAGRRALAERGAPPKGASGLYEVVAYLNSQLPEVEGLFARQYSEGGVGERLFFSAENGRRIDSVHNQLMVWRQAGTVNESEHLLLLTGLLEAVDRVANISGTYGAFLKKLQGSARDRMILRPPVIETQGPAGRVFNEDANALVRRLPVDVLYLDPPYNGRQYAKNYHVVEVLAELHSVQLSGACMEAYEAEIYGKGGLRPFVDRQSSYCRKRKSKGRPDCAEAFFDLVTNARAEHIVVSYSEEGILSREQIGEALAQAAGTSDYDYEQGHLEIGYKRFRSDADKKNRTYRQPEGRAKDVVAEWLFYVHAPQYARPRRRRVRAAS